MQNRMIKKRLLYLKVTPKWYMIASGLFRRKKFYITINQCEEGLFC